MPTTRGLRRVMRVLQVMLAAAVGFAVYVLAIDRGDGEVAVLPDTAPQFSLDLEVVGSLDRDVVYVVEQRARPAYRIFEFNPRTGEDETMFTVPEDAIVYGIALSPDRSTLAVAYAPDYQTDGSGLWTLDLDSGTFAEVVAAETNRYLTEPEWSSDGSSVLMTHVDRTGTESGDTEELALARVSITDASLDIVASDAITPTVRGDDLYYLVADAEQARRAIGHTDAAGRATTIEVGDGTNDLDHLIAGPNSTQLHVAVLDTDSGGGLTLGAQVDAHGNHDVPSTWWSVDVDGDVAAPSTLESTVVYDADGAGDDIVYATREGLTIAGGGDATELIASRAIRFVTG